MFGFAKVTVNNRQVTVTPTDEMGRTYDIQTYNFPGSEPDSTEPDAADYRGRDSSEHQQDPCHLERGD